MDKDIVLEDKKKNRSKVKKRIKIAIIVLLSIFILLGLKNDVMITNYKIVDSRVKEPFGVVQISDTHSCYYGESQKEIVDKVKELKPDLIFLTGDIIDDKLPEDNAFELLEKLKDYKMFYVTGNHEIWTRKSEELKERIRKLGITVLDGKEVVEEVKGNRIRIMGVDDTGEDYGVGDFSNIKMKNENADISMLLFHRPDMYDAFKELKPDYIFSGHAHGAQWRIPFILENGLLAPAQGFFPKLTKGVHDIGFGKLIISRGLSRESTRIPRFYNRPEIISVDFSKE